MYSWEVERVVGFQMDPERFKHYVEKATPEELKALLESMGCLFGTVRDIGKVQLTLTPGQAADWLPLPTPTSRSGTEEYVIPGPIAAFMKDYVRGELDSFKDELIDKGQQ